eukprot:GHVT01088319.1.p1 GENE.GHVT01088319.1~~GHVT01088319.1.p1  ORF type:complete len:110 (+),score=36.39 GHVT01088319.1:503-832(+)
MGRGPAVSAARRLVSTLALTSRSSHVPPVFQADSPKAFPEAPAPKEGEEEEAEEEEEREEEEGEQEEAAEGEAHCEPADARSWDPSEGSHSRTGVQSGSRWASCIFLFQ